MDFAATGVWRNLNGPRKFPAPGGNQCRKGMKYMRKYLFLAAAAAAAIASPAAARDGTFYAGLEGGLWGPSDTSIDVDATYPATTVLGRPSGAFHYDQGADIHYRRGYDVDALAGYDLGRFRVEGELGYKRADIRDVEFTDPILNDVSSALGIARLSNDQIEIGGHVSVLSAMVNGLVDFGDDAGWRGYFGGGAGYAHVKNLSDSDSGWALQGIAGFSLPLSTNMDLGLKYRYFRTSTMHFNGDVGAGTTFIPYRAKGRLESHSLLLSLIYNFAAPPPPPPPPPAAPERGL